MADRHPNFPSILESLQRFAPRPPVRQSSNPKNAYEFLCPFHDDDQGKLSVNKDGSFARCWHGCGGWNDISFYRALSGEAKPPEGPIPSIPKPPKPKKSGPKLSVKKADLDDVTLADLCQSKGLDPEWCQRVLNWQDDQYPYPRNGKITRAVYTPYFDQDGKTVIGNRWRTGLTSKDAPKYLWKAGSKGYPYGLPFLALARQKGYLIIEEGETDFAALLYHDIPALAVAGNQMWKAEFYEYIQGIPAIYIMDEGGEAGQVMVNFTASRIFAAANAAGHERPKLYRLTMPDGQKDPCEVAQLSGDQTEAIIDERRAEARLLDPVQVYRYISTRHDSKMEHRDRRGYQKLVVSEDGDPSKNRMVRVDDLHVDSRMLVTEAAENIKRSEIGQELFIFDTEYFLSQKRQIPQDNPYIFPWQGEYGDNKLHGAYLVYSDGEWEKNWNPLSGEPIKRNPVVLNAEMCGEYGFLSCPIHGHDVPVDSQGMTKRGTRCPTTCALRDDPNCSSKIARDIARVQLADLIDSPTGAAYRNVWFSREVPLGARDDYQTWEYRILETTKLAQQVAGSKGQARLKNRTKKRSGEDRIYHRNLWFHLDWPFTTAVLKVMFYESGPGSMDRDIQKMAEDFGGEVVWDHTTQVGEDALLCMTLAASASVGSLDRHHQLTEQERMELHSAFWNGTKKQKINVPMDALAKLIADLPPPEKPLCEICGEKLQWVLDTSLKDDTSTSPTSPDYAWRDPRDGPL